MSSSYFSNLRPFEKRVVVAVGVMLFIVLNMVFVFPHFKDLGQAKILHAEALEKLEKYNSEIRQLGFYRSKVAEMESASPPEDQAMQFSRTVNEQQIQSGVQIMGTTRTAQSTNQFFVDFSQNLTIQAGEQQLIDFLYNLGSGKSLIRVRDLTLGPDPPRYQLNANVKLVASYQKPQPNKAGSTTRAAAEQASSRVAASGAKTGTTTKSATSRR